MSDAVDESRFTAKVIGCLEASLSATDGGRVVDAEGDLIAACITDEMADVVCKLLNWALDNYPFHHPDDPTLVRKGLH